MQKQYKITQAYLLSNNLKRTKNKKTKLFHILLVSPSPPKKAQIKKWLQNRDKVKNEIVKLFVSPQ